jgi:small conductance mechanosensitive channel
VLASNLTKEPEIWVVRSIAAVLVLLIAWAIGRAISGRVRRSLDKSRVGPNPTVLLVRVTRVAVWVLAWSVVLAIFQVPVAALAAVLSIAVIGLSLSLQDVLRNLIAGIYLLIEKPFQIGDHITVSGVSGIIDDIEMRVTHLHNAQGEDVIMPNLTVFTQVIVNNTVQGGHGASLTLTSPRDIAAADLSKRAIDAVAQMKAVAPRPEPRIEARAVSPEATNWLLSFWLNPGAIVSDVILALGEALPEATVSIPA